jgi:hypothetical protein
MLRGVLDTIPGALGTPPPVQMLISLLVESTAVQPVCLHLSQSLGEFGDQSLAVI